MSTSNIAQVALCTADLPRTVRTFVEILGFENAGGKPRWGEDAARIQELPSGDETSAMMWWLVGRQDFVQIELFHHSAPRQRPRREGWQPSDLGWGRFGVVVPDLDVVLDRLRCAGFATMTQEPMTVGGHRRVCFREPGADAIVEVMEEDLSLPASASGRDGSAPAVAYAAATVSDLDLARRYFVDAFGFSEVDPLVLHHPEHERLWGLAGARRDSAVFRARDILIELSHYEDPVTRPQPADALLSDQGMMNVAIGFRDRAAFLDTLSAAESLGATASTPPPLVSGSVYLRILDRLSIELLVVPEELDAAYGFVARELAPPTHGLIDGS